MMKNHPKHRQTKENSIHRNVEIVTAPKRRNVENKTVGSCTLVSIEEGDDNGRNPRANINRTETKKDAVIDVSTTNENYTLSRGPESFPATYTCAVSHHISFTKAVLFHRTRDI